MAVTVLLYVPASCSALVSILKIVVFAMAVVGVSNFATSLTEGKFNKPTNLLPVYARFSASPSLELMPMCPYVVSTPSVPAGATHANGVAVMPSLNALIF